MFTSLHFENFRGLDNLSIPLTNIIMLTGTNGVGKTSILEGLYCLLSETRIDVASCSRYNRTLGLLVNNSLQGPIAFAARQNYNYKLFWNECPTFGNEKCKITANDNNGNLWTWLYKKANISELDKSMTLNYPNPIDSTTEFALWSWSITKKRATGRSPKKEQNIDNFKRAQVLSSDDGLYLLPQMAKVESICRYLDFPSLRLMPNKLPFDMSKQLTEALKIINPHVTDVRLSDVNSGLFVVLDDKNELSLSAVGNGSVTLASAMLALYDIRSLMDVISKPNFPVMVLIDEIGAGIHYSVMRDIWAFVKKFSQQNPQIQFVTTSHNDDCVRAFCETFIDYSSASIVRLSRIASEDKITHTLYPKEKFPNIISGNWEVRG